LVLPQGADAVRRLEEDGRTLEFIKDQYRHCKPLLAFGDGAKLLAACGIETNGSDTGLIVAASEATDVADAFVAAIAKHRHFTRETDPPRV
jgi:catalase